MINEDDDPLLLCAVLFMEPSQSGNTLNLFKVFDELTICEPGSANMTGPVPMEFFFGLIIDSVQRERSYTFDFFIESPGGERLNIGQEIMGFADGQSHGRIVKHLSVTFPCIGTFWFRVYCDGQLFAKTPLRIIYDQEGVWSDVQYQS
jgi:hypothetical protein